MTGAVIGAMRANLSMNSAQFRRGASEAQQSLNRLRNQFRLVAAGGAALGAALTASVVSGLRDVDRQAKAARSIDGTTSALRAVELAAGDAGVEVGLVTSGMQKMARELARAASEAGPARDALDGIGLSANDLLALDADDRLAAIADRTRELGFSAAQTTNLLRDLGVGNTNFAKIIVAGGDAIRAARNEVREFGLELDAAGVAKVEAANDSMSRLGLGFEAFRNQLAISVAPALLDLSNGFVATLREGGLLNTMIASLGANIGTLVSIAGTGVAVFGVRYVAALAGMRIAATGVTFSLVQMRAALASTGIGALVVGAGILVAKLTGLDGTARSLQIAIDNVTLAMADEIRQVQLLTSTMGPGTRVSEAFARQKLAEAEASLANVDAKRQEAIALVRSTDAYRDAGDEVNRLRQAIDQSLQSEYNQNTLGVLPAQTEALVADLGRAQVRQAELIAAASGITPEYQAATAEIARIKAAIAGATDGMVTFSGEIVPAVELGGRLHNALGGIDFSQSVRGAQQLAKQLEVSLSRAMQIMGLVGAAAQAEADAVVYDPRDPRFDPEAAARAARLERISAQMEAIQDETVAATVITPRLDGVAEAASGAARAVGGIAVEAEEASKALSGPLLSGIDSVSQAFGDFTARGFKDFKGFVDQVKGSFKQLIASLIATAAKNQIMISLGLGGGAGGGGIAGAGASLPGGGSGGLLSGGGIAALGSSVLRGLSGVGAGIASGFASGGIGAAISGGFSASVSGISSGLLAGGAAGIGAAVGAALPIVGVGLALFSLFGKKKKPIISSKDLKAIQTGLALTNQSLGETAGKVSNFAGDFKGILGGVFDGLSQRLSSKGLQRAARNLKNLAGGAEEFTKLTEGYFENFFSETEKRALAIEGITATFDELGLAVPATASGFRELVESFDLTTKEGRKAYVEVLKVSDAFAAVYGTAQAATEALSGFYGGNIFTTLVEQRLAMAAANRGANVALMQSGGGVINPNELVRLTETGIDPALDSSRSLRDLVRYFQRWEIDGLPPERAT